MASERDSRGRSRTAVGRRSPEERARRTGPLEEAKAATKTAWRIGRVAFSRPGGFDSAYHLATTAYRQRRTVDLLRHSPLFSRGFYALRCEQEGIPLRGVDPVVHFLGIGLARGISPHPIFDPDYYIERYPDVGDSAGRAYLHYVRFGADEGRDPGPLFDTNYYVLRHPVATNSGVAPVLHFLECGGSEGNLPSPYFDTAYYLRTNPDVALGATNPLVHYLTEGWREGRRPSREFDPDRYVRLQPDARNSGRSPLEHLVRFGPEDERRAAIGPRAKRSSDGDTDIEASWQFVRRWRRRVDRSAKRALYVELDVPKPDRDSGSITTLELMIALQSLGYSVSFAPFHPTSSERHVRALESAGFPCLDERAGDDLPQFLQEHGEVFEVVVLSRVTVATHMIDVVRAYCPNAVVVFETMDLHFLREERQAELAGEDEARADAARTRRMELDVVRRSDATIVHSSHELEVLASLVPGAQVVVLPYVLDLRDRGPARAERETLLFVGGFAHAPNVDAVTWFVREVMPGVRRALPHVRLRVVGSGPLDDVKPLEGDGVEVVGFVEDLAPEMDAAVLTVAPLRYGAGYKGKVAMSLAHGVPVVGTSVAMEGMALEDDRQVLVADSAGEMVSRIVSLYRDPTTWNRLSDAGRRFVVERFSRSRSRELVADLLRSIGVDPFRGAAGNPEDPTADRGLREGFAVYPSRFMDALHRGAGIRFENARIVPHGVDFVGPSDRPMVDRGDFVVPGTLRLLFAGRVTRFKGTHTILEALPRIVERLPHLDVRLSVVGDLQDESYRQELTSTVERLRLSDRVSWLPPVAESELGALFDSHDLYLFPSLFEPFALTLILALESGIPTVASDAGGNVDIVTHRDDGLLFRANDAADLAAAVEELATNRTLRCRVGRRATEIARRFDTRTMIDRLEQVLFEASGATSEKGANS